MLFWINLSFTNANFTDYDLLKKKDVIQAQRIVFPTMVLGRPETTCKSMDMDLDPMPQAKVNSERVMDLNVRADTLKGLKENTGVNLCDLQFGNGLTLRHDTQAKREKQI